MTETSHDAGPAFSVSNPVAETVSQETDKPRATLDDMASLLEEFDSATKSKSEQKPETKPEWVPDEIANDPVISAIIKTQDRMTDVAQKHLGQHAEMVQRLWANELRRQDEADFGNIVGKVERSLAKENIPVAEGRVKDWLTAQALTNPQLRDAFDNRYKSPQHEQAANRLVKRATDAFIAQVREDHAYAMGAEIAGNREAVASYLRGASTNKPPPEPPVRYGSISDAELRQRWDEIGAK